MSAWKNFTLLILVFATFTSAGGGAEVYLNGTGASGGQQWLLDRQALDGSFDPWFSASSSLALIALNRTQHAANKSAVENYLNKELLNSSSFTWSESDTAALAIYALAYSGNLTPASSLAQKFASKLLTLQDNQTGGFKGLWEFNGANWAQVPDAVSTSLALIALNATGQLDLETKNAALDFLLSLKSNYSFNLTQLTEFNSVYALGNSRTAVTSLVLLALKTTSYDLEEANLYLNKLEGLGKQCFNLRQTSEGAYGYSVALTALAAYGREELAKRLAMQVLASQNQDGGFSRPQSFDSNAMDTAVATWLLLSINLTESDFKPDLKIIDLDGSYILSNPFVYVTLSNCGYAPTNRTFANFTINGISQTVNVSALQAFSWEYLTLNALVSPGFNRVEVQLDQNNEVDEVNESNNFASLNFFAGTVTRQAQRGVNTLNFYPFHLNISLEAANDTLVAVDGHNFSNNGNLNSPSAFLQSFDFESLDSQVVNLSLELAIPKSEFEAHPSQVPVLYYTNTIDSPFLEHAVEIGALPTNVDPSAPADVCSFMAVAMRLSEINYSKINSSNQTVFEPPLPQNCESEITAGIELDILRYGEGFSNSSSAKPWQAWTKRNMTNRFAAIWLYRIARENSTWHEEMLEKFKETGHTINFSSTLDPEAELFKLQAFYAYTSGGLKTELLPDGTIDSCFECEITINEMLNLTYHFLGVQNISAQYPKTHKLNSTASENALTTFTPRPGSFELKWENQNNQANNENNVNNDGWQSGIRVIVDMPLGEENDVDVTVQQCTTAKECFELVATLSGTTYNMPCPSGSPASQIFIDTVNEYYANFSINEAYWEFQYNGETAQVGISCQHVQNGDAIKLRLSTNQQQNNDASTSSSSSEKGSGKSSSSRTFATSNQTRENQNNTNKTNNTLTTDIISPINTRGFNAPNQTAQLQNPVQTPLPAAPTGLFETSISNPATIIAVILLIIAGYVFYAKRQ